MVMRQNVVAGKTPIGTKVEAKLTVATLVQGVVIPQDAIFSGEVTESAAKSASEPSRLGLRMETAQWKNGAAPVVLVLATKVYLTSWFYPPVLLTTQDFPDGLPEASRVSAQHPVGAAPYPDPNTRASPPLAHGDTDKITGLAPPMPSSAVSKHRVLMKNVESMRTGEGAVALTAKRFNIKLDKTTTYVLAAGDLLPAK